MRNALIIPAIAAASLTAIPAFAYDGPISDISVDVPAGAAEEGAVPAAYIDTITGDVEAALRDKFDKPTDGGFGLRLEASVLSMEIDPTMGTMEGQVAVFGADSEILDTFLVELEADTVAGNTDPEAYYGPMIEKFATISAEHVADLPVNDEKSIVGEAAAD
ncbi:hypothetical protein PSM7751_02020 [Pseudooceanicola marinus]|uniref:Uncharacterized protein n=1 Tax=Pseudooceanicola marinus TaxID=396013 RepID=A0A1X6Z8L3_9RHOB|nr:hypothetical protein [Pseudooceanicola marinus]PJE28106.1 hypothetical protein CVM50_14165 [Pseudooceanicola marinus]SLN44269.1 hypothetical protein PSM7751_02020 [Pseudooceanicola marinus]